MYSTLAPQNDSVSALYKDQYQSDIIKMKQLIQ